MRPTTWILTADSSRARILQVADHEHRLVELQDILNPQGRLAERELITDAHPRFRPVRSGVPGSDRQETAAAEHATELFAKHVAGVLDQARVKHRYDRLYVVAAPKFLGLLRKELDKEVAKLVADEIPKDLSWLNARELEKYVAPESGQAR